MLYKVKIVVLVLMTFLECSQNKEDLKVLLRTHFLIEN